MTARELRAIIRENYRDRHPFLVVYRPDPGARGLIWLAAPDRGYRIRP